MPYTNHPWLRPQVQSLMEIASALGELSHTPELCERIPAYLSAALGVNSLTIAIVQDLGDSNSPQLYMRASSGFEVHANNASDVALDILTIHQQTRPLAAGEGPALRPSFEPSSAPSEMSLQHMGAFPRATVLARKLDAQHRFLLIVHQRADEAHLSESVTVALQMIADHLAKQLTCLVGWQMRNMSLGEPFDRLTEREWMVLRGLSSEAGEKQLADQLNLSPHTLHSHIKSIYRKVGVQGRLPLLSKIQCTMRSLRLDRAARHDEFSMSAATANGACVAG